MTDRITMLNRALLRIGEVPLVSEADPGAPVHLAVYDSVLERMASHPWTFFKATRRLARLATAPGQLWTYAFQMPTDRLGPIRALYASADTTRRPTTAYDIVGDQIHSDEAELWASLLVASGPERWPGDFRECFTTALMAELALSVREDRVLHDRLWTKAFGTPQEMGLGGIYGAALSNDNQSTPSVVIGGGGNPLIDVRY